MILSAKYGLLHPVDTIAGPYDVTFKRRSTRPVNGATLRDQVRQLQLDAFDEVIGLRGREYREALRSASEGTSVMLSLPFAGLPIAECCRPSNGQWRRATEEATRNATNTKAAQQEPRHNADTNRPCRTAQPGGDRAMICRQSGRSSRLHEVGPFKDRTTLRRQDAGQHSSALHDFRFLEVER